MSKLTTRYYKSENLTFQYNVNIDKDCMFTTTIPAEVVEKMKTAGIEFKTNRLKNEGYFVSDTIVGLEKAVKEDCDKYSKKELVEEKIILRYSLDTTCSYCKTKDGQLVPNGHFAKLIDGDYNWTSGTIETNYNNLHPFGFTCYVKPYKVTMWKFPDGMIQNVYDLLNVDKCEDETLQWLAGLCGINSDKYKEVDYTPELGLFFKNIILYIFRINEQFLKVFGKTVDLSKGLPNGLLMLK